MQLSMKKLSMKKPRRGPDGERGVTLVEVLIAVVILGLITVPLGNAIFGFIRLSDQTNQRLSESQDAQLAGSYFAQDVQGLGVRDWTAYPYPYRPSVEQDIAGTDGRYKCGGPEIAVVRLAWDDPDAVAGAPRVFRASYVVRVAGDQRQLHRILCVDSPAVVSDLVIARSLDPARDPRANCPPPGCTTATVPTTVSLTVSIRDPRDDGAAYVIVLSGQRRPT